MPTLCLSSHPLPLSLFLLSQYGSGLYNQPYPQYNAPYPMANMGYNAYNMSYGYQVSREQGALPERDTFGSWNWQQRDQQCNGSAKAV